MGHSQKHVIKYAIQGSCSIIRNCIRISTIVYSNDDNLKYKYFSKLLVKYDVYLYWSPYINYINTFHLHKHFVQCEIDAPRMPL